MDTRSLKVANIARHYGEIRLKRSSRDERVPLCALVRNMKSGACQGNWEINVQYAPRKGRNNLIIQPSAHLGSLEPIPPLKQQDTDFQLKKSDNRNKES